VVQASTKFELVINLKTAKAISLNRSDRGPMGEALEKCIAEFSGRIAVASMATLLALAV
jgi:hypothetical protein